MIKLNKVKSELNSTDFDDKYKTLSYEESFEKLKQIVEAMQMEQLTLEETVNLYKEGKMLSEHCNKLLNTAKFEIDDLIKNDQSS